MSSFSRVDVWCALGLACVFLGSTAACKPGRDAPPSRPGGSHDRQASSDTRAASPEPAGARPVDGSSASGTIAGNVTTITVPGLLGGRRVWVYLPPGYDDAPEARYPVLYMLDGQNVFDETTSYAGEWQVDEICEALIARGEIQPIIVVAVDNARAGRLDEYAPWADSGAQAGGGGDAHLRALVDILVPHVDETYRTRAEPAARGLAGSSLGGLMALYAAYTAPETFGLAAGFSPSLEWDDRHLTRFIESSARPAGSRVYMDMGTRERGRIFDVDRNGIDDHVEYLRALRDVMIRQGFVPGVELMVVEAEGARHHEVFWSARFPETLKFLFPARPAGGGRQ